MAIGAGILDRKDSPDRVRMSDRPPNERAEFAFERGNWTLASSALAEMLEEDQFDARSIYYLAFALQKQKKYDEARSWYEKAMDFHNYRPVSHYHVACIYALQGNKEESLSQLKSALDLGFKTRVGIDNVRDLESLKDEEGFRSLQRQEQANRESRR